jgi:hypothetical protein
MSTLFPIGIILMGISLMGISAPRGRHVPTWSAILLLASPPASPSTAQDPWNRSVRHHW